MCAGIDHNYGIRLGALQRFPRVCGDRLFARYEVGWWEDIRITSIENAQLRLL